MPLSFQSFARIPLVWVSQVQSLEIIYNFGRCLTFRLDSFRSFEFNFGHLFYSRRFQVAVVAANDGKTYLYRLPPTAIPDSGQFRCACVCIGPVSVCPWASVCVCVCPWAFAHLCLSVCVGARLSLLLNLTH